MGYSQKYPRSLWIFVTFLLMVHYFILSLIVHNILPIDFHVRGVDYRSLLSVYKVYFAMIMLNGAIMFFYQVKAEKLNLATKMITYIISTIHILYEICFLMFLLSTAYIFFPSDDIQPSGTWITAFQEMKSLSNQLQFRQINLIENYTHHEGISEPSYLPKLIDLKGSIDKIQSNFQCCGLYHPSEWVTDFSGNTTKDQRNLGHVYIWWAQGSHTSWYPNSCCIEHRNSTCLPVKNGCMETVSESVWTNILGISLLALILGTISVCRDITFIKFVSDINLKPFPVIMDEAREKAGRDNAGVLIPSKFRLYDI